MSDSPKDVTKKVNKAVTGGGDTAEEQRKNGSNLDVDVPF
jgi:tryptophanyl-tRNA synthetase